MLRQFDLASKYGPCTDLSRLERWERAFELVKYDPFANELESYSSKRKKGLTCHGFGLLLW